MNTLASMTVLAAAVALAACDSRQDATVGQKVDQAVASAQTAAADVKQSAKRGLDQAAEATKETSEKLASKVDDAAITASVKAGIAKDPELSALRVDVDTQGGHVMLSGVAPNAAAKERAQAIAAQEKGVTSVDNRLAIEHK
ncbi:MAG TPA: BON domain-containing protein [Albitalea sp.]|nr:BON domain-containing protein [Albitalea sp.]